MHRTSRAAARVAVSLLLAVVAAVAATNGGALPRSADAQIDDLQKVAAAAVSIPTPLTTAIAAAQSAYKLATWGQDGNKVDVKLQVGPSDRSPLRVDLGMTYIVPFEMTYSFNDTPRPEEYVFAELYIVSNAKTVLYYKRIPERGYFAQSKNYFDDSSSGKVTGSLSLGAKVYDPSLPKQKLEAIAVMYRTVQPKWQEKPPYGGRFYGQNHHYITGRGVTPVGFREGWQNNAPTIKRARAVLIGLQLWAGPVTDEIQVMVTNPFFVESTRSDNGQTKTHPEQFHNDFFAVMQYRWNYPGIKVGPPSPPWADVKVKGFDPANGWTFTKAPATFQLAIKTGIQSTDRKAVNIFGNHSGPPHSSLSTYATTWSVEASGRNNVEYEKPGSKGQTALREYKWQTVFRVAANDAKVLPAPYTASDRSSGVALLPPTETPTETPTPTASATPSPTPTPIDYGTPSPTPTPIAGANRAPAASAITASFFAPTTTYILDVTDADGDALTVTWSGPDCGTRSHSHPNDTRYIFVWSHPHPPCPSGNHADVTVTATVTDDTWLVTCTYRGAESGTGPACTTSKKP